MKEITGFINLYYKELNKPVLLACTLLTSVLIFLNFHFELDHVIVEKDSVWAFFGYRFLIFLVAFSLPYFFYLWFEKKNYFKNRLTLFLIILSPAIFSWRMAIHTEMHFTSDANWNYYWNHIIYWPLNLIMITAILFLIWLIFYRSESFFGVTGKNLSWKPYLALLTTMIPLVALASAQPDFLKIYPKLNEINQSLASAENIRIYQLLYKLSYGTDFITIELFFRGFLILAFVKVAGKDAILPMACFYCVIHFGKPLGECISSWFGGIFLGILVFHTRSIWGGLLIHLGIAWLMEVGGYSGNLLL